MGQAVVQNGTALTKIVIVKNAPPSERYAASELRHYLELMTNVSFSVEEVSEKSPGSGEWLAVGGAAALLGVSAVDLQEDGFVIECREGGLGIFGGSRGVIYGVYELLERLGCRFFSADCERIPSTPELFLPELSIRQVPVFELRDHNYCEIRQNPRFGVKLRLNGSCTAGDPEKLGGYMKYARFVHTFEQLVPTSVYGESHPEYYSLEETGKRNTQRAKTQLCLSNPEVLRLVVENTRKILQENPDARIMSISQNDWEGNCRCPDCLALDREEGGPSGTLLRFVNAVAEQLEPEFPHVIFDTLAYQYTRPIPRRTRPRHNVCVRLCSIECCFSHAFETCDQDRGIFLPDGSRTSFVNDLQSWGSIHDRVYIWDYTTSFSHYPAPHPNWRTLQPNMRLFKKNNVKGVFEQANGAQRGGCDLNELRAYVIAKLLWDPDTDISIHIREFTDYFYGAAAPYIRQYIELLCDRAERDNLHVGYNDPCDSPLFCEEMLNEMDSLLRQGEQAVTGDPMRLFRTAKIRLSVRYLRIKRHSMLNGRLDPREVNEFFTDWKAFGLSRMEEWVAPETSLRALLLRKWRGVEFYSHWTDEGPEEF